MPIRQNNGWELCHVGSAGVARINPPYGFKRGEEYSFIPMESVREECGGISGIHRRKLDSNGYTFFRDGDILFAKITPCTENGKIARVAGLDGGFGFGSTEFIVISPDDDVDGRFLYYHLSRGDIRSLCTSLMEGSTGRQRVPPSIFRNRIEIQLSQDRKEQARIADALETVDTAIAAARDSIAKTERLQKALMQQLLSGRMRADGRMRGSSEFVETKLGLLPRTWSEARVKDFGDVSTGKTPPTAVESHFSGDVPFITPGDMGSSKWLKSTERKVSVQGARIAGLLPERAVCSVCIGATIGKIGLTDRASCTNQQINSVVCLGEHCPEFLYYALRYHSRRLQSIAGVNATPQLNKSEFSKFRIPMPENKDEEEAIVTTLGGFDELVAAKHAKIAALQRLKKSLMQNLLTGKIRLPVGAAGKDRAGGAKRRKRMA